MYRVHAPDGNLFGTALNQARRRARENDLAPCMGADLVCSPHTVVDLLRRGRWISSLPSSSHRGIICAVRA
jgi:hypothetical protein